MNNKELLLKDYQKKYRLRHKNCNNCLFKHVVSKYDLGIYYKKCEVKDKIIKYPKLKGMFCNYYTVEGE